MNEQTFITLLGSYCREFRITVLDMTLSEVANESSIKTLSGFEHGRSNNFMHLFKYINACRNELERNQLIDGLNGLLKEVVTIED